MQLLHYLHRVLRSPRWALASYLICKMIQLKASTTLWGRQLLFLSMPEVLACRYTASGPHRLTSEAPMATQMALYLCLKFITTLLGMLIRVEEGREPLQFILSHGIQTSMNSFNFVRTMELRRTGLVTCSTLSGSQIFSWRELKRTRTGLSCAQMNAQDCLTPGEKNLRSFTSSMRKRREAKRL